MGSKNRPGGKEIMKCPECQFAGCKYIQRRPEKTSGKKTMFKRTDFKAKCKKCGWEGEI